MNTATHCDHCGKPLGADKYIQSPEGGICRNRAWCPGCHESLTMSATKARVERYAAVPAPKWDHLDDKEDDNGKDY